MDNISKMTNSKLERVLSEAQEELARRNKNCSEALANIKMILKKHKLRAEDIDWSKLNKTTKARNKSNATVKTKAKNRPKLDQRSSVAPKYFNPNGKEKWTGRGRAPGWVMNICEKENTDIKKFKLDPRFRI